MRGLPSRIWSWFESWTRSKRCGSHAPGGRDRTLDPGPERRSAATKSLLPRDDQERRNHHRTAAERGYVLATAPGYQGAALVIPADGSARCWILSRIPHAVLS